MTPYAIIRAAKEFDIAPVEALRMRYRYLLDLLAAELAVSSPFWPDYLCELRQLVAFGKRYAKRKPDRAGDITDDMIEQARAYPMTQLIEFKRGKTQCFVHDSKDPDMAYHAKTNTVRCFGSCCKSFDTIGVLMIRDGLSFPDAVRYLQ
jgi:hypothetical protein